MPLYAAVALCALLAGLLVYRYDLYDREPWYALVFAAFLGALGMRLVGAIELESMAHIESRTVLAALAAVHEELARLVLVFLLAFVLGKHFNDPMDGIVYGSTVGLGMALEESYYTISLLPEPPAYLLPVELVRLLGHLIMGGIVGFAVGLRRAGISRWKHKLFVCVLTATIMHFIWDALALSADDGVLSGPQTFAAISVILFGMIFYGSLVVAGSKLSKTMFAPSSQASLWGWPFTVLFEKRKQS